VPTLPVVVVGVPYHRDFPAPFVQSLVGALDHSHRVRLEVRVAYAQAAAVHIARENLLRYFLGMPDADFLVTVDTDQVFRPETLERLTGWKKPLVSALIVNRLGEPRPVAFRRAGTDLRGMAQYRALAEECWAYLSQFEARRLEGPAAVLPQIPDREAAMRGLPEAVRAGLGTPLLAVDAVGGGMTCLSREAAARVDPGPDDRYFDWEHGGEDLSFCRRVLAAGYLGYHPSFLLDTDARPHGVFVDRGCLVGHLTEYARGAVDLGTWLKQWAVRTTVWDATDLAERLADDGARPSPGPWEREPLPDEEAAWAAQGAAG
jgi:hypothetical protein